MDSARAGAGVLFGALDFGLLTLAGPAVGRSLDLGTAYPWLFSAGSLSFAVCLPIAGMQLGRHDPRRVLCTGAMIAAFGLALTAVAPSAPVAIAARVVTGVGGAGMLPAAWAILAGLEGRSRGRGFAASGGAVAVGFSLGVALGGPASHLLGWRGSFGVAAGFALVLAIASRPRRFLPGATSPQAGLAWLAIAAGCAAVAVTVRAWSLVAAVVALVAAAGAGRQLRGARWLPETWTAARFCVLGMTTTASGVGGTALLGQELVQRGGGAYLALIAFGAATPAALPAAVRIARDRGAATCATAGLLVQGAALMALAGLHGRTWEAAILLAVVGAGHAIANAGTAQLAMEGAGSAGPLASLLGVAQYLGGAIGALVTFEAGGLPAAAALAATGAAMSVIAGRASAAAACHSPAPS